MSRTLARLALIGTPAGFFSGLSARAAASASPLGDVLPGQALKLVFAAVMLCFAASLFRRALRV